MVLVCLKMYTRKVYNIAFCTGIQLLRVGNHSSAPSLTEKRGFATTPPLCYYYLSSLLIP